MKKSALSKFYPLFFTSIFITIILQYSFYSIEAFFYDLRIRTDFGIKFQNNIVLVTLDEESNDFLGEVYPFSMATHERFIKRLTSDEPSIINYFVNLNDVDMEESSKETESFLEVLSEYKKNNGSFRFGTDLDAWGEQTPPDALKSLGWSLAVVNRDTSVFARDNVTRRAIVDVSGDPSIHLWTANQYRKKRGLEELDSSKISGTYYSNEAEATFFLFRYFANPVEKKTPIQKIPFHRVVVGNFPKGYFKDKIVLVGTEYLSDKSDYILTPYNKEDLETSRLVLHSEIIQSLIQNKTIYPVPRWLSNILTIILGIFLSLSVSKLQPAKGLAITIATLFLVVILSFIFFSFGYWVYTFHLIFTIIIVYYIWIPFRAIEEYQSRYKIEEESKILKKVESLKQNFISLMSHDLKTPVAKIAGLADILLTRFQNSPDQYKYINQINDTTKELNKFITSILDLTKIESKNLSLSRTSKDINIVIEDVIKGLKFEAQAKKITINKELSPLYPVSIDIVLMNRVISNLLENAIKYSGEGSIVEVSTWDDDKWVYVKIADNGSGIDENELEYIFEKFYRVKNDSIHKIKGSGLGLYLVKYFVELHEGTIEASSEVGKGTTFIMKLINA